MEEVTVPYHVQGKVSKRQCELSWFCRQKGGPPRWHKCKKTVLPMWYQKLLVTLKAGGVPQAQQQRKCAVHVAWTAKKFEWRAWKPQSSKRPSSSGSRNVALTVIKWAPFSHIATYSGQPQVRMVSRRQTLIPTGIRAVTPITLTNKRHKRTRAPRLVTCKCGGRNCALRTDPKSKPRVL